ncbi:MAG: hypothetical protein R2799_03245 [Crocinitomicaceae bacterium]
MYNYYLLLLFSFLENATLTTLAYNVQYHPEKGYLEAFGNLKGIIPGKWHCLMKTEGSMQKNIQEW